MSIPIWKHELDDACNNGTIADATPEQLNNWLTVLTSRHTPVDTLKETIIVRGLAINHAQMARTIKDLEATMERLNAANGKMQDAVMRLTRVAIWVGIIQAAAAIISIALAIIFRK